MCVCVCGHTCSSSDTIYNFKEYYTTQFFFYMQILTNLSLNCLRAIVKNPFKESFYGKKSN